MIKFIKRTLLFILIVALISGGFIIVIGLIFKFIIKSNIYFINISNVINVIFNQFLVISMVFYICGIISYLGYYLIIKSV